MSSPKGNIALTPIRGDIRSCNCCAARNYKSHLFPDDTIVELYELKIESSCVALCSKCLDKIAETISAMKDASVSEGGSSDGVL